MKKIILIIIFLLSINLVLATFPENMTAGDTYSSTFNIIDNPKFFLFYINKTGPSPNDFTLTMSLNDINLNCTQEMLEWICSNPSQSNGILKIDLTLNVAGEPGQFDYTFLAFKDEILLSQIFIGGGGFVQPPEEETEVECEEDWTCSEWSECLEGAQARTCDDLNDCRTYNNQPLLSQSCSIEETPPLGPTGFFLLSPPDWILGIIIGILMAIFTILLLKRRKKFVMSP